MLTMADEGGGGGGAAAGAPGGPGGVKRSPGKARGVANADAAAREADPPAANGAAAALDGLSLSSDK